MLTKKSFGMQQCGKQFRHGWVVFTLIGLSLIAYLLYAIRFSNRPRSICEGGIPRMLGSAYYKPFKMKQINSSRVHEKGNLLWDKLTNTEIYCKYQAAYIALYSREKRQQKLFDKYEINASVLLQYRHDAMIGLPGGGIRPNEYIQEGLNRELLEELNNRLLEPYTYQISHLNQKNHYCGHLFTKELSWNELHNVMITATQNPELGIENLGYLLLPVLIENEEEPSYDGLPMFLAQALHPAAAPTLVGNTLQQLLFLLSSATHPPLLKMDHINHGLVKACEYVDKSLQGKLYGGKSIGATLTNFYQ